MIKKQKPQQPKQVKEVKDEVPIKEEIVDVPPHDLLIVYDIALYDSNNKIVQLKNKTPLHLALYGPFLPNTPDKLKEQLQNITDTIVAMCTEYCMDILDAEKANKQIINITPKVPTLAEETVDNPLEELTVEPEAIEHES
jgi:hypothetical protein